MKSFKLQFYNVFFFCQGPLQGCKSRWHFGAGLANCAKRACTLLSIYCLMVKSCNTFGVATSPNVADLSTSLNAGQWNDSEHVVLPRHHHHSALCSLDFRSTKRALSDVLSTKSSTKRRKNEGRSKHWIQILGALSYQPFRQTTQLDVACV